MSDRNLQRHVDIMTVCDSIEHWSPSERCGALLAQSLDHAFVLLNPEGKIVDWSAGAEHLLGWHSDEVLGQSGEIIFTPEDRAQGAPQIELDQAREHGKAIDLRWHIRKDGTRFFCDGVLTAIRASDGRVAGFGKILRDISQRKHREDFLQKQASLLDLAYDPAFCWDLQTNRIHYWNHGAQEMYGFAPAEALGRTPHEMLTTEFPETIESIKNCLLQKRRWAGELVHTTRGGERIHVDSRMVLRTDLGEHPMVLEVNRDITKIKQAAADRDASEKRFRMLVTATSQIVWQGNAEGELIEDSPSWRAYTGQTYEEYKGYGWMNALHPDDPPRTLPQWQRAVAEHTPYYVEHRVRRADGQYRWTAVRAVPILNDDGTIREWIGTNTDIQEQKEADLIIRQAAERLRLATQAAKLGIWSWEFDADAPTWENPEMYAIFGVPEGQPLTAAQFFSRCSHPDDTAVLKNAIENTVRHGEPYRVEYRIFRQSDRALRWIEATGMLQQGTGTQPARIVGTLADITERKETENALRELAASLSTANRRQSEFLATLAHELRNPLAPIKTGLDLIRMGAGNADTLDRMRQMMDRQVDHLVHLVNDLLDLARINSGKIELQKTRIMLKDAVLAGIETSLPAVHAKHHHLSVDIPDEPIWLDADPTRLAQIVGNVLTNAAKYTPSHGHISLTVRHPDDHAEIIVKDDGMGIPAESLPYIFEMFTQVGHGIDHSQGGLGIGLNLVRRLTEKHGGTVTAESAGPGLGSTFTVRLPVLARRVEARTTEANEITNAPPRTRQLRILVADDNEDAALTLKELLEAMGHIVTVAHNGTDAVQLAQQFVPDMSLLDIGMPNMNGYEVVRVLRDMPALHDKTFVAVTGWGAREDRDKSREAGFTYHATKPVDYQVLLDLTDKVARSAKVDGHKADGNRLRH